MVGTLARDLPLILYFDDWSRMSKRDQVSSNHVTMIGSVKITCVSDPIFDLLRRQPIFVGGGAHKSKYHQGE